LDFHKLLVRKKNIEKTHNNPYRGKTWYWKKE